MRTSQCGYPVTNSFTFHGNGCSSSGPCLSTVSPMKNWREAEAASGRKDKRWNGPPTPLHGWSQRRRSGPELDGEGLLRARTMQPLWRGWDGATVKLYWPRSAARGRRSFFGRVERRRRRIWRRQDHPCKYDMVSLDGRMEGVHGC